MELPLSYCSGHILFGQALDPCHNDPFGGFGIVGCRNGDQQSTGSAHDVEWSAIRQWTISMRAVPQPNIVSAEFKADPFPFLTHLRASEPVYRTTLPDGTPVWLVTRYNDVLTLLRDERFTKNRRSALTPEQARKLPWTPPMFRPLERNMLDLDPPDHTRLRSLVHKAFTPQLVDQHENARTSACRRTSGRR